nr:unnamed protein product [Digitaria exilis]
MPSSPSPTSTSSWVTVFAAPAASLDLVLAAVHDTLPAYLSTFFPFAGCVVLDAETKIPKVHCTNDDVEPVVADVAGVPFAAVDFTEIDLSLGLIKIPFDVSILMTAGRSPWLSRVRARRALQPLLAAATKARVGARGPTRRRGEAVGRERTMERIPPPAIEVAPLSPAPSCRGFQAPAIVARVAGGASV